MKEIRQMVAPTNEHIAKLTSVRDKKKMPAENTEDTEIKPKIAKVRDFFNKFLIFPRHSAFFRGQKILSRTHVKLEAEIAELKAGIK